jgi:transposase
MRAGADRLLNIVVNTVGAAQAHHGYLFANPRATRIKLLVHDGFGVWCATRRLHAGSLRLAPPEAGSTAPALQLSTQQFEALVLGLPWQRLGERCATIAPLLSGSRAVDRTSANGQRLRDAAPCYACRVKLPPPSI